jgi:nicotinamidase-related amidase
MTETSTQRPSDVFGEFNVENTALVMVDQQTGTIEMAAELTAEERPQVKMWARAIARFAKGAGIPIVLTSSLESEQQGPLLPEFQEILPEEYERRIQRTGVVNAWDDPAFVGAVHAAGKRNLLVSGLTTDVCLVPMALSARRVGFNVVALMDSSAATSKLAALNSRALLTYGGVAMLTTTAMITSMLGDYNHPAAQALNEAFGIEGVFEAFAAGNLR